MFISNKHNNKTFTKSPSASLLHCIENILNHFSGKCFGSLTMAALSSTRSTLYNIYSLISPQQERNYQLEKRYRSPLKPNSHILQQIADVKTKKLIQFIARS